MPRLADEKKYVALLTFLQRYFDQYNYAPTYEEMRVGAGLSSKCIVDRYLKKLCDDGMVQEEPNKSRTLRLTDTGKAYPNRPQQRVATYVSKAARINATATDRTIQLKVVGRTFAGQTTPIPNSDFDTYDEFTTIEVSESILPPRPKRDTYFVLEVSGESMIEAGIFNGDYVICRRSQTANTGDMVVALLQDKDETTLKYFFPENGQVRLQPANSTMQPIIIHDPSHLMIQGVVVQVVHCRE